MSGRLRLAVARRARGIKQATQHSSSFGAVHQEELGRVALRPFIDSSRNLYDSFRRDIGLEKCEVISKQFARAVSAVRNRQFEIEESFYFVSVRPSPLVVDLRCDRSSVHA